MRELKTDLHLEFSEINCRDTWKLKQNPKKPNQNPKIPPLPKMKLQNFPITKFKRLLRLLINLLSLSKTGC